jgi:putative restriction endonuclease
MPTTDSKYGSAWGRDELILALYLYCQVPFAQTKASNPEVVKLAHILRRTPSSVARKLGNFGAFDPLLAEKGIVGLVHYSKADKDIWHEFYGRWDALVDESEQLTDGNSVEVVPIRDAEAGPVALPPLVLPTGPTSQPRLVMTRLHQSFFRKAVLASYRNRCCVCSLELTPLLVGSHIKPWAAANEEERTDPENGLCLCVLHDKAYDRGLLTVTTDYRVLASAVIKKSVVKFTQLTLAEFNTKPIQMPSRFAPKPEYLQWHRKHVFQG